MRDVDVAAVLELGADLASRPMPDASDPGEAPPVLERVGDGAAGLGNGELLAQDGCLAFVVVDHFALREELDGRVVRGRARRSRGSSLDRSPSTPPGCRPSHRRRSISTTAGSPRARPSTGFGRPGAAAPRLAEASANCVGTTTGRRDPTPGRDEVTESAGAADEVQPLLGRRCRRPTDGSARCGPHQSNSPRTAERSTSRPTLPMSSAVRWNAFRSNASPCLARASSRSCSHIRSPTLYDGACPGQPR